MSDETRILPVNRQSLSLRAENGDETHLLGGEILVGREVECDIQLSSPQISRYHAKIVVAANGAFIEDLKSSNGTYVNGRQVHSRVPIHVGDQIGFDEILFRLTSSRSGHEDRTIVSPSPTLNSAAKRPVAPRQAPVKAPHASTPRQPQPVKPTPPLSPKPQPDAKGRKVHEIPDVDEFLAFAGSGLTPQAPLSTKQVSPFGLSNREDVGVPLASESSRPNNEPGSQSVIAEEEPLGAPSVQEAETPQDSVSDVDEEENTRHVGLNDLDRYVANNARAQEDLSVGSGPRLIAMTAPIRGKVFSLASDEGVESWSIGRDDGADICLRDKAVSREHAWITKLEAVYQLSVSELADDVLVNGRCEREVTLNHGDRLQLGTLELLFRLDSGVKSRAPDRRERQAKRWWQKWVALFRK